MASFLEPCHLASGKGSSPCKKWFILPVGYVPALGRGAESLDAAKRRSPLPSLIASCKSVF